MLNSIWGEFSEIPRFPRLEQDIQTDVLIVGGGLAGLLCAYQLKQAGVSCVLIEADRICRGVSRNTTAKITAQHGLIYSRLIREFGADTARAYWEANTAALEAYRRLAGTVDCDFETRDNFIYATKSALPLAEEMAALKQLGIPAEYTDRVELPFPTAGAVRFRDQAQFHPLKFAADIAAGLNIYEHTAAKAFSANRVETDGGTVKASKIIVATHFPILNKHGAYFLKMYQQRSFVLALEGGLNLDGMYLGAEAGGFSFRNYGNLLLLGGGGHRTGKQGGGWQVLEAFAAKHFPEARVKYRWATQDCMTLDGIPYIGRYGRGKRDLYVAAGFNKWGMTSSMAAAAILRDLVQGKENPYESVFDPARSIWRPQLLRNALEATTNLLRLTGPRCPHLGCALKWNPQERSWDCPCHGSRFAADGKLLDNPATADLKNSRSS